MEDFKRKKHWENIYQTKKANELSWFQQTPETSLHFFREFNIPKTAKIIDIGGGDSLLVDRLLEMGYHNITVLDISEAALNKAKNRLGKQSEKVKWLVADAASFIPNEKYDFWHDRAAFHFLTDENDISNYIDTAQKSINASGILLVGTFSNKGPSTCSGIEVKQYTEDSMTRRLQTFFEKIKCIRVNHKTPFDTTQNFVFCSFRKP